MAFKTTPMLAKGTSQLGLKSNGTVWTSGLNIYGALGRSNVNIGSEDLNPSPVLLENGEPLNNIVFIDGGYYNCVALDAEGHVWIWGSNTDGLLGLGQRDDEAHPVPQKVPGIGGAGVLNDVKKVLLNGDRACALFSDGRLCTWGGAKYTGGGDALHTPTYVIDANGLQLKNIIDIAKSSASGGALFALSSVGEVYAWGGNTYCGVGDINSPVPYPTKVIDQYSVPITDIKAIAACAALKSDGTVLTWGLNDVGELGIGGRTPNRRYYAAPALIDGTVERLFSDHYNIRLARLVDGSMVAWGQNGGGELGIEPYEHLFTPTQTNVFNDAIEIRVPASLFYKSDGTVWVVGRTTYANNGPVIYTHIPTQVLHDDGSPFLLWGDGEGPDPSPDPEPGDCCCKCCGPRAKFKFELDIPLNCEYTDSVGEILDKLKGLTDESCK